ncbi:benzoate/H(+) symporter BenE family transporter [Ectobacillus sp. JY-23]|uniref:benzoate/H(+) symporter BenE family transporter n=1 Tax=Ectobacillus sp. JY-23 TaxID=2933872 RepID=UPI0034A051F7
MAMYKRDISASALTAAFVATMVGYAGPLLIIFQAAELAGLNHAQLSSWIWAISFGCGITSFFLSMYYRVPVLTAWSTPGAVLLVSGWAQYSYSEAIGAFFISAVIITILGITGIFEKLMNRIPMAIISAMLAGVLLQFGLDVFVSIGSFPALVVPMILVYVLTKRWLPRYAVILTLLVGISLAAGFGRFHFHDVTVSAVYPVFTMPTFSLDSLIGLALPLCIVTMTAQNATGIGVLRASGYNTPASPLISVTGIASLLLAPFGSHSLNIAAITAAICTGEEAHPDKNKRYIAGMAAGVLYVLYGFGGATITSFFSAFPRELILVIGGLALLPSISSSLAQAMAGSQKESALITFLVTASGVTAFGIGSAFWGLLAGICVHTVWSKRLYAPMKKVV